MKAISLPPLIAILLASSSCLGPGSVTNTGAGVTVTGQCAPTEPFTGGCELQSFVAQDGSGDLISECDEWYGPMTAGTHCMYAHDPQAPAPSASLRCPADNVLGFCLMGSPGSSMQVLRIFYTSSTSASEDMQLCNSQNGANSTAVWCGAGN
jgi:hypothetical protein